ncbi:unnamed protein product [Paramecium primaurelia]|uniref:Uncharacterized protein n=1 Tax=Paramecium primaurelia TaxID=5886 RepID=A0A8S1QE18_PARPR|nr:unnamed protein product [Paramecium primaurelia]
MTKNIQDSVNERNLYKQLFKVEKQDAFKNYETIRDDEQLLIQQKEIEYLSTIEQAKLINIIDLLDNKNFFSKYSIFSQQKYDKTTMMTDNIHIKLSSNDFNFVGTVLQMKIFTVFEFYETFINFYNEEQIQKQRELDGIYNNDSFAFDIYESSYSYPQI